MERVISFIGFQTHFAPRVRAGCIFSEKIPRRRETLCAVGDEHFYKSLDCRGCGVVAGACDSDAA